MPVARIFLGVTGGIAAYKACELLRLFVRAGHEVTPLVTPGADRFVRKETFRALARVTGSASAYPHLEQADLLVIAPLSANTLAKLAQGLADNTLTEAALAHEGPILVAPAMNHRMWAHPATQQNAATLRARGIRFAGPVEGELAEGEHGLGRMAEPQEIFGRAVELLGEARTAGELAGKRVLVTAGGTREPIDAVRFVGNRSSGRMGTAIAAEARRRGARVTLVGSNLAVPPPDGVEVVSAATAADVEREVLARADADVVVMTAAVADYRPKAPANGKPPKHSGPRALELEPTTDVLRELGRRRRNGQLVVGFAAEAGEGGLERARAKLAGKGADVIVYNDVGREDIGFDSEENEVVVLSSAGERHVPKASKRTVAAAVLDEAERLLERGEGGAGR